MRQPFPRGPWVAGCASVILILGLQADAGAYESGNVEDGAVVRGKVTFTGTEPDPKEFELRRSPDLEFCSAVSDGNGHRLLKEVNIGPDGGLKDVVVVMEGVERG